MNWNLRRRLLEYASVGVLLFTAFGAMGAESPQQDNYFQFGQVPPRVEAFSWGMSSADLARMVERDGGTIETPTPTTGERANEAVQGAAQSVYDAGQVADEFLTRNLGQGLGGITGGATRAVMGLGGLTTQGAGYVAEYGTDTGILFHENVNMPVYENVLAPMGRGIASGTEATLEGLRDAASATGDFFVDAGRGTANFFDNLFGGNEEAPAAENVAPTQVSTAEVTPEVTPELSPVPTTGEQVNATVQEAADTVYQAGRDADSYLRENLGDGAGSIVGGLTQAGTGLGGLATQGAGYVAEYATDGFNAGADFVGDLLSGNEEAPATENVAPTQAPTAEVTPEVTPVPEPIANPDVIARADIPAPQMDPTSAPTEVSSQTPELSTSEAEEGPNWIQRAGAAVENFVTEDIPEGVETGYDATVDGVKTGYNATADFVMNDIPDGAKAVYDTVVPSQESVDKVLDAVTPTKETMEKIADTINPVNWFGSDDKKPEAEIQVPFKAPEEQEVKVPFKAPVAEVAPTVPEAQESNIWDGATEVMGDAWEGTKNLGQEAVDLSERAWNETAEFGEKAWDTVKKPFETGSVSVEQTTSHKDGTQTTQMVEKETPSAMGRFFSGMGNGLSNLYHRGMRLVGLEADPITMPLITPYGAFPVSMQPMAEPTTGHKIGNAMNAAVDRTGEFFTEDIPAGVKVAGEFLTEDVPAGVEKGYDAVRDFVTPASEAAPTVPEMTAEKAPQFAQLETFLRAKGLSDADIQNALGLAYADVQGRSVEQVAATASETNAQPPVAEQVATAEPTIQPAPAIEKDGTTLQKTLESVSEKAPTPADKIAENTAQVHPQYSLTGGGLPDVNITVNGMLNKGR